MRKFWRFCGRVAFWLSWPALFIYLRIGRRTRVVIICDNKIVVTKGWLGTGKWSLPGGGTHHGEKATDGAIREVFEETGLRLEPNQLKPLGNTFTSELGLGFTYDQFAVSLNQNLELIPRRFEIIETAWLPINELNENNTEKASLLTLTNWKKQG